MKILYCKKCISKNKDRLTKQSDFSEAFSWSFSNGLRNYKGVLYRENIEKCPMCEIDMDDTNLSETEFNNILDYSNCSVDFLLAMIELKKNNIIQYTNQLNIMDSKMEEQRNKNFIEIKVVQKTVSDDINKVHCPRCGSTQITTGQTLQRALFGLMYNQITVNRCANCGCTWRPGI